MARASAVSHASVALKQEPVHAAHTKPQAQGSDAMEQVRGNQTSGDRMLH